MTVYYEGQTGVTEPIFFDAAEHRIPKRTFNKRVIQPSKMFVIKEELKAFVEKNPTVPIYNASQGDGGMSLGGIPPEELAQALLRYLPTHGSTKYGDPVGRADIREAIAKNYYGFSTLGADNIILGDGGRDLLQKWYQLIQQGCGHVGGSLIVSAAPWGSYMQGTYMSCLNTISAPGSADDGFQITPEGIDSCIARAEQEGMPVVALVITTPDNPTGNYLQKEEIARLIEHAAARGIRYVLVDLMYQSVTDPDVGMYDIAGLFEELSSAAKNAVFFLDGLTKSVGGSNLRNCHLVCGGNEHILRLKGLATHSVLPNALGEAAALAVYGQDNPIEHPWVQRVVIPTAESRALLKSGLAEKGFRAIIGQGYYAFINVWPWLNRRIPTAHQFVDINTGRTVSHIDSATTLKSYLAQQWGLAIIHGSVFRQPAFIRFSYANTPAYTQGALHRFEEALSVLES
ncbi:MAG: aminotransferase class I/II-fold pyridoxal phosphate-dependent enzyme [Myxococcota bacterium]|nr:aminotransferase class I/II-fold pyridoxal phosphate-dependent enzyme [Myxococcota bacterium]